MKEIDIQLDEKGAKELTDLELKLGLITKDQYDDKLELSEKSLKENLIQIGKLRKEAEGLRNAHYRYEAIWKEIPRLESRNKKIYSFLENSTWRLNPELKQIAKKLIEAKENHKFFDENEDYLLFDEIIDDFITHGRDGRSYHLHLIKTHFRHYDVMKILKSVERITKMKVKEWYLLTTDRLHRPAWDMSITLVKKTKEYMS